MCNRILQFLVLIIVIVGTLKDVNLGKQSFLYQKFERKLHVNGDKTWLQPTSQKMKSWPFLYVYCVLQYCDAEWEIVKWMVSKSSSTLPHSPLSLNPSLSLPPLSILPEFWYFLCFPYFFFTMGFCYGTQIMSTLIWTLEWLISDIVHQSLNENRMAFYSIKVY